MVMMILLVIMGGIRTMMCRVEENQQEQELANSSHRWPHLSSSILSIAELPTLLKTLWARRRVFQDFRSNFYACKISVAFCSTKPTRPVSLCNNDIIVICTSKPGRQEHYNKFWWSILLLPNIRRVLQEHSSIHHTLNVSWIFLFLLIDSSHFECVFNLSFLFFLFLPCRYKIPPDIILANYEIQKQRVT